mgnify:CR=1 FL=1
MKNIVEIIYPKGERFPQISINGEKISRYMELSDLIYDDMFNWVEQLYTSMDDELCEKYVIQITGHLFHYQILKGMKGLSSYCEEIEFTPVQYTIPVEEKLAYAANLNRTYQLGIPFESEQVLFCTDDPARFGPHLPCDAESSNYFVTAGEEFPAACKYCVIVSDTMRFRRKHGVSYLYLPEHLLALLGNYLNQYHLHLQFINAVFSAAGDLRLDEAARLEYEAYTKEEYRVLSGGLPAFDVVGLGDAAVKEARERVRSAIKNCGFSFPVSRITVNLAPADLRKVGTAYDLPILVAILGAAGEVRLRREDCAFVGELSLAGAVRPVAGMLPMALAAKRQGLTTLFVPEDNAPEATLAEGVTVHPVASVPQLVAHLRGETLIDPAPMWDLYPSTESPT